MQGLYSKEGKIMIQHVVDRAFFVGVKKINEAYHNGSFVKSFACVDARVCSCCEVIYFSQMQAGSFQNLSIAPVIGINQYFPSLWTFKLQ